eukprot:6208860-Pleurochrysis_carterae.AAC.7
MSRRWRRCAGGDGGALQAAATAALCRRRPRWRSVCSQRRRWRCAGGLLLLDLVNPERRPHVLVLATKLAVQDAHEGALLQKRHLCNLDTRHAKSDALATQSPLIWLTHAMEHASICASKAVAHAGTLALAYAYERGDTRACARTHTYARLRRRACAHSHLHKQGRLRARAHTPGTACISLFLILSLPLSLPPPLSLRSALPPFHSPSPFLALPLSLMPLFLLQKFLNR